MHQLSWLAAAIGCYCIVAVLPSSTEAASLGSIATGAKALVLATDVVQNSTAVLKRNCAYFGWYPDDGDRVYGSEGTRQTLQEINAAVGTPAFALGGYAHQDNDLYDPNDPSTFFNGSELLPFLDQAVQGNATFVASVAPVHGYGGFTANDTTNVDALIKVLGEFVDAGVTVWLRWAHEFNWYTLKGSDDQDPSGKRAYYGGNANDYITVWKFMYARVKAALPTVQFMWCANTGPNDLIRPFWPGQSYVDMVGMDYYTYLGASSGDYYNILGFTQDFHDEFALPHNLSFWLAETGTRTNSTSLNLQWVKTCTSQATCDAMPNYRGMFWFNYIKNNLNHNLVLNPDSTSVTQQFIQLMQTS